MPDLADIPNKEVTESDTGPNGKPRRTFDSFEEALDYWLNPKEAP